MTVNSSQAQFLTVESMSAKYPSFSAGSLRWLLFNRQRNGFNCCVVRIGRKVLIDEAAFVDWLRSQSEARVA